MAVSPFTEPCDRCGDATPHNVRIEILEETQSPKRVRYSREPYRIPGGSLAVLFRIVQHYA